MRYLRYPPPWQTAAAGLPVLAADSINQVINNTTVWLVGILAGLATLFLTIGGVRYLMAGGDPAEVSKAKIAFRSAAIGYGLAGVAMPGLRRAAASLSAGWRGDTEDLQADILTGLLSALRALDLDDLDRVPLASRLCWAAWRAGQKHASAGAAWASRRRDLDSSGAGPALPWGHPDFVLAAAVRARAITAAEAELIGRNRLEGIPLSQVAAETGVSHSALCHRRRRAETRLIRAISDGILAETQLSQPPGVKNPASNRISDSGEVPRGTAGARRRPVADTTGCRP